jgi:lysozyme family protein
MASFDVFLPMVLRFEGGYVDDPADPGGETNKGITMTVFQHCAHELLGIDPTSQNLKNLTDGQAGRIYKVLYWDKIRGDALESQNLANIVCDFYVNAGTNATKLLQSIVAGLGAQVVQDGVIGTATLQALRSLDSQEVYRRYRQGRIDYYQRLVNARPSLSKFLDGWLNRVNAFPAG